MNWNEGHPIDVVVACDMMTDVSSLRSCFNDSMPCLVKKCLSGHGSRVKAIAGMSVDM